MKVMSIFGTRPEAIKMAPLVKLIEKTPGLQGSVCVTAQHRQMLDQVLEQFDIRPDYDLNLMRAGQTLASITAGVLEGVTQVLLKARPDVVLVHGDTTTSTAAALAAFYQQITVGHVEAGLRSQDKYSPFPEEMNRRLTSRIAALHFAPTELNREHLKREGIEKNVFIVGNTVIDALNQMVHSGHVFKSEALRTMDLDAGRIVLLTAHRRENLGTPLKSICRAVLRLSETVPDIRIIYPVHLNPAVRETVFDILGGHERIHLIDPIEVEDMHNLMQRAHLVMTDSGGLQEEAPALGKPVVVLRSETERPEVIEAGKAILAGVKEEAVYAAGLRLLRDPVLYAQMAQAVNPYGDGHTCEKIVEILIMYASQNKL